MAKEQGSWTPNASTPASWTHSQTSCTSIDSYYTAPELEPCGSTPFLQQESEFEGQYFTPRESCTPVPQTPNSEDNSGGVVAAASDIYDIFPPTDGGCLCQACVPLSPRSTSTVSSNSQPIPSEIGLFEEELAETLIWIWQWPGNEPANLDHVEWYPPGFPPYSPSVISAGSGEDV